MYAQTSKSPISPAQNTQTKSMVLQAANSLMPASKVTPKIRTKGLFKKTANNNQLITQRALFDTLSKLKTFVSQMWKAKNWQDLSACINTGSSIINDLISQKKDIAKVASIGSSIITDLNATISAGQSHQWLQVIDNLTKAISDMGDLYYAIKGKGMFSKVVVTSINHLAQNIGHIVNAIKAGG